MLSTNRRERLNRRQVSRQIIDRICSDYENEQIAKIIGFSKETTKVPLEMQRINQQIQKFSKTKSMAIDELSSYITGIVEEIEEIIKSELRADKPSRKNSELIGVTSSDLEKVVNMCMPAIIELKELSKIEKLQVKQGRPIYNFHERLFNHLTRLDVRFACFAPKSLFNEPTYVKQLNGITDESKAKIDSYIADMEIHNGAEYVDNYIQNQSNEDDEIDKRIVEIIDNLEINEKKCKDVIVDAVKMLAVDIHQFVENEIEETKENGQKVDLAKAKELLALTLNARVKLVGEMSNRAIANELKYEGYNPHRDLLENLIKTNGYFLIALLSEYSKRQERISIQEKRDLFEIIDENNIFSNPKFAGLAEKYSDLFKDLKDEDIASID